MRANTEATYEVYGQLLNGALRAVKMGLDIYIIVLFARQFRFFLAMKKKKLAVLLNHMSQANKVVIGVVSGLGAL